MGKNIRHCSAEEIFPFENNSFDKIILKDILEHLLYPEKTIKECYRVLQKGGYIYAFSPDAQKWVWDDYSHKRPFSKKSMITIFKDHGFKIKKCSYEPIMPGINKFCKFFKLNKRPVLFWWLAKLSFFRRNVFIIACK